MEEGREPCTFLEQPPPNLPAQHISISAASAQPGESLAGNEVFSFVLRGPFPTHRAAWCSPAPAPALVIVARPRWLGLGSGAFVRLERGEEEPTAFVWLQHSWGLILRFLPPPSERLRSEADKAASWE